jgi:hypothetical protein
MDAVSKNMILMRLRILQIIASTSACTPLFLQCLGLCFCFPWNSVCQTKISLRAVFFFCWLVALEKILTMDNMRKRHVIVVDKYCCMCKKSDKFVNHFLFQCEVVDALWNVFFI